MIWVNKPYLICDIQPGMILGRPLYSDDGQVLLSENTTLTVPLIQRLSEVGFATLYIKEPIVDEEENVLSLLSEQRIFSQAHAQILQVLEDIFEKVRRFQEVPIEDIEKIADESVNRLVKEAGIIRHLNDLKSTDDYTFVHSLNVGILSGVIGKWMGYTGKRLKDLIMTGLLHDIGKTQIPLEILNKPGRLTEEEMNIMQEHATLGFEMVKKTGAPKDILLGIWQHHERLNGEGYPFQLTDDEICPYARIVAVADMYDAMTSDRVYRQATNLFKAIEEVFSQMFGKLDPEVTTTFLYHLKDSLVGYIVRLSDGSEARVIHLDRDRALRPIVKLSDGRYIDLEARHDLVISEVISSN
ncbi:MAG: rpfG 14 [Firmicutes bacterium]|nr:rpfG 14 [Bacillota bacterium]